MKKVINYVKDTRGELKHVSWPSRKQAVAFTAIVLAVSLAVAFFLGFFDFIFSEILNRFILQ